MEHVLATGVYSLEVVYLWTQGYIGRAISFMYPFAFVAGRAPQIRCFARIACANEM